MHTLAGIGAFGLEALRHLSRLWHSHRWHAAIFLIALDFANCAPGMDGARQSVATAAEVNTQMINAFVAFDKTHQRDIVDEALKTGIPENGQKKLAEYREKRSRVVDALAYSSGIVLTARATLPLVEVKIKSKSEINNLLLQLAVAAKEIYDAFDAIGFQNIARSFK